MSVQAMKQAIRQRIIADRQQIPVELRASFGDEITRRILLMPRYQAAQVVLGYMNFGAEFVSDRWAQQVLDDGKQLLLPKVNLGTRMLDIYRVASLQDDLAPGLWGIREPMSARCSKVEAAININFILLPGVAFGRDGVRLGYGGGFYDKLIARLPHHPTLVGAAYAMQMVTGIPEETTDRRVHWLVTEKETINCSGR